MITHEVRLIEAALELVVCLLFTFCLLFGLFACLPLYTPFFVFCSLVGVPHHDCND